jgi:hypothetical protein
MPVSQRNLRQSYCPNFHHALFFSTTQARESRFPPAAIASPTAGAADLKSTRRHLAPSAPEFAPSFAASSGHDAGTQNKGDSLGILLDFLGRWGVTGAVETMKFFASVAVSAALMVAAEGASAQMLGANGVGRAHYQAASDFDGPYGPPPLPPAPAPRPYGYDYGPRYGEGPQYGYGPALMPLPDVYAVLRENGFSPLGIPHQRGVIYVIAAIDRAGQDGRLVIDGRNGQIIRFTPAWRWGSADVPMHAPPLPLPPYGAQAALPPPNVIRGAPPPALPQVATRNAPVAASKPASSGRSAEPSQQAAAVETRPAAAPPSNMTTGQTSPPPQIRPTQEMPKAQGLE